jgi:prepilin-type N-terminal cleavage/methylation domain-containing protein
MLKSIRKSRQSGFTLVELGIVLALIGIGLFFAISKMQETGDSSRAQNVANDISSVITGINRFYSTSNQFPNAMHTDLINNKAIPPRWVSGAALVGPFGGTATLARTSASASAEATLTILSVPPRVCIEMGKMMASYPNISVGGEDVKTPTTALDVSKLTTECNDTNAATMAFLFYKV